MAKAPNPNTVARKKMAEDEPMRVTWDGKSYAVRAGEITARQEGEIRKTIGRPLFALMGELDAKLPSLEAAAVILWLARVQAGDVVTLDSMLDVVTMDVVVEMSQEAEPSDPPT